MTDISTLLIEAGKIAIVSLNRPKKFNALSWQTFAQLKEEIERLGKTEVRCIIFNGIGQHFTAGLDLGSAMDLQKVKSENSDAARNAFAFFNIVKPLQLSVSSLEEVRVPVIAAMNGYCIGAGVDLSSACDIRICTIDTQFCIKEVDIGLAADIGTLQRFQKVVGNESWARELAYTARVFKAEEALAKGYVSEVLANQEECLKRAVQIATLIASKSPIAISTTKRSILYSRDHSVSEGLDHIALLNSVMLQSEDVAKAAMATMSKQPPHFNKL